MLMVIGRTTPRYLRQFAASNNLWRFNSKSQLCLYQRTVKRWFTHSRPNCFPCSHATQDASKAKTAPSFHIEVDQKLCHIKWSDGFQSQFHGIWLRHNCHCADCCFDNGQRLFNPPPDSCVRIESLNIEDDHLKIKWLSERDHHGTIPLDYLRCYDYTEESLVARRQEVKLMGPTTEIPVMAYEEMMSSNQGLLKWLQQINEEGISLVQDVPIENEMVCKVAERIGPVLETTYGRFFELEAVQNPINVAYSNIFLELHTDLVFCQSPPGLQLLHCMRYDDCVEGGESNFLDCFAVAEQFRCDYPDLFDTLTKIPFTYWKKHYGRDNPIHLATQKTIINLNHKGDIVAVYWAPTSEGPLAVSSDQVQPFYTAFHKFAQYIQNSSNIMTYKMEPGELIVFNNLRMLHGRKQFFTNGGERYFQGCYINIDDFKSKAQTSKILYGDGKLVKRVGNNCWT